MCGSASAKITCYLALLDKDVKIMGLRMGLSNVNHQQAQLGDEAGRLVDQRSIRGLGEGVGVGVFRPLRKAIKIA